MRLIDADALILEYRPLLTRAIEEGDAVLYTHCKSAVFALKSSPTISLDSLRAKGRWIWNEESECWVCSNCELSALNNYRGNSTDSEFCPHCGFDMREGKT